MPQQYMDKNKMSLYTVFLCFLILILHFKTASVTRTLESRQEDFADNLLRGTISFCTSYKFDEFATLNKSKVVDSS